MASVELATGYISLIPSMRGLGNELDREVRGAEKSAQRRGGGIGSALATGIKRTVKAGLAGGALFAGISLKKGLDRLLQIDDARASLSGLGHDVRGVDKIMSNALASVKGTAFGLGDAAGVAASAVAAGIKPGNELTRTLKLTADAATIAKTDMGSMGAIFNKVASSNKIQGDVIAQLNDAGIPIVQLMAKELGITAEETVALASAGEIGFSTFQDAMEKGLGGAALKSGETVRGSLANIGASMSRIGAGLLSGTFPYLAPAFQGITEAMEPLEGGAEAVGQKIGKVLGPALENIGPAITRFFGWIQAVDFSKLGDGSSQMGRSFQRIGDGLAGIDVGKLKDAFGQGAADTFTVFSVVIGFVADHIDKLAKVLPFLIAGLVAYKAVQAANNVINLAGIPIQGAMALALFTSARANNRLAAQMAITNNVERVGMVQRARATVGIVAHRVATVAQTAATKAAAVAQRALNLAMRANPIGLVIAGIAALVAGLVWFFTKTETGQRLWSQAWSAIQAGLSTAWNYIRPVLISVGNWFRQLLPSALSMFRTVAGAVFKVVGAIFRTWWAIAKGIFTGVKWYVTSVLAPVFQWLWSNVIKPVFGWIGQRISNVWNNVIKPAFNLLRKGVGKVGDVFSSVISSIRSGWGKLKGIVQAPIKAAIGIINGFIRAINKIPGVPDIPLILSSASAAPKGVAVGALRRATGGAIFGPGTGTSDSILTRLSNNEHVWTAREVARAGGHRAVEAIRAAVSAGQFHVPGFARGGPVVPGSGNRHTSGYPWATYAGDFPNPIGTPVKAWKSGVIALVRSLTTSYGKHIRMNHPDGTSSLYAHLSSFAKSIGDRVRQGAMIGRVGSTGNSTGPHLHLELLGGHYTGGGGGSIWDTIKGFGDKVSGWIKSKLLDKADLGGLFGDVSGLFSTIGGGVKDWAQDELFDRGGLAEGAGVMGKRKIAPERVLDSRQTRAFEAALDDDFRRSANGEPVRLHPDDLRYLAQLMAEFSVQAAREVSERSISSTQRRESVKGQSGVFG